MASMVLDNCVAFKVPSTHLTSGVPGTGLDSGRAGVFCWSCVLKYGAKGRSCCWRQLDGSGILSVQWMLCNMKFLVPVWPPAEQEFLQELWT